MNSFISFPSPNYNQRRNGGKIDMLILHYTGMKNAHQALKRLCDPDSQVSCHYLVDREGVIYRLVDDSYRAWHAGVSYWQGNTDINSRSLGIELENTGHEGTYEDFTDIQIQSLVTLCLDLIEKYSIPAKHILAHSDIAPLRKKDPGEKLPWRLLAENGIGIMPNKQKIRAKGRLTPVNSAALAYEISNLLYAIGYDVSVSRYFSIKTGLALQAFKRHFGCDANSIEGIRIALYKMVRHMH